MIPSKGVSAIDQIGKAIDDRVAGRRCTMILEQRTAVSNWLNWETTSMTP